MSAATLTRTEEAYKLLRRAIVKQELRQGTWLRQRTVAAQLGMSPTPLVQAFHRLEQEGLLECVPQWGVRVRSLTVHELKQVYAMRLALESIVFRELASRADKLADRIRALRPLAEQVDRADEGLRRDVLEGREKLGAALLVDQEFHLTLARLSGMELVAHQIDRLCLLPVTAMVHVANEIPSQTTHVDLLEAILSADPDHAERTCRKAIGQTAQFVLSRLGEQFGDEPIVHTSPDEPSAAEKAIGA